MGGGSGGSISSSIFAPKDPGQYPIHATSVQQEGAGAAAAAVAAGCVRVCVLSIECNPSGRIR